MANRITVDDYVMKELEEYRNLHKRYEELIGVNYHSSNDDSFLISLAISGEIEKMKRIIQFYEEEKSEVNDG